MEKSSWASLNSLNMSGFFLSASLNWKYFLPWSEKDNNIIFSSLLVNPLSSLGNHPSDTAFPITELKQSYHGNSANLPVCSFSYAFGPFSFSASTDSLEHLGLYGAPISSGYTALVVPKKPSSIAFTEFWYQTVPQVLVLVTSLSSTNWNDSSSIPGSFSLYVKVLLGKTLNHELHPLKCVCDSMLGKETKALVRMCVWLGEWVL